MENELPNANPSVPEPSGNCNPAIAWVEDAPDDLAREHRIALLLNTGYITYKEAYKLRTEA